MNIDNCLVKQYRIRYREEGQLTWSSKTILGSCNNVLNTTSKTILGLVPEKKYEYQMKAWYCNSSVSGWSDIAEFTTLIVCPNIDNLSASSLLYWLKKAE